MLVLLTATVNINHRSHGRSTSAEGSLLQRSCMALKGHIGSAQDKICDNEGPSKFYSQYSHHLCRAAPPSQPAGEWAKWRHQPPSKHKGDLSDLLTPSDQYQPCPFFPDQQEERKDKSVDFGSGCTAAEGLGGARSPPKAFSWPSDPVASRQAARSTRPRAFRPPKPGPPRRREECLEEAEAGERGPEAAGWSRRGTHRPWGPGKAGQRQGGLLAVTIPSCGARKGWATQGARSGDVSQGIPSAEAGLGGGRQQGCERGTARGSEPEEAKGQRGLEAVMTCGGQTKTRETGWEKPSPPQSAPTVAPVTQLVARHLPTGTMTSRRRPLAANLALTHPKKLKSSS